MSSKISYYVPGLFRAVRYGGSAGRDRTYKTGQGNEQSSQSTLKQVYEINSLSNVHIGFADDSSWVAEAMGRKA